jgi:DNA-binding transcriptional regulator GbsR (MarR family)
MKLTAATQRFVLQWGELGSSWGINRTVAQIHALLYLSPEPLNAEEIAETLSVARSNVSSSLKELQGWGIVKRVHRLGDRRDHFEALADVWEMARVIAEERKRRELDPTLAAVRSCVEAASQGGEKEAFVRDRLTHLLEFMESLSGLCDRLNRVPTPLLKGSLRGGDALLKRLGLGRGARAAERSADERKPS